MNLIHENLKKLRLAKGLSQRDLADAIGVERCVIQRIEANTRYAYDIEVKALCKILGVTYEEIMGGISK